MAKRKMTKAMGRGMGKGLKSGGAKDGARKSKQGQSSALLPQNRVAAGKRMRKMEKADVAV